MRRRLLNSVEPEVYRKKTPPVMTKGGGISSKDTVVGDLVYVSPENGDVIIMHNLAYGEMSIQGATSVDAPLMENYVLIGIVVVPGTHNAYGDNSCGIVSIHAVATRNTGTSISPQFTPAVRYLPRFESSSPISYIRITPTNTLIFPIGPVTTTPSGYTKYPVTKYLYSKGITMTSPFLGDAGLPNPGYTTGKTTEGLDEYDGYSCGGYYGNAMSGPMRKVDALGATVTAPTQISNIQGHYPTIWEAGYICGAYNMLLLFTKSYTQFNANTYYGPLRIINSKPGGEYMYVMGTEQFINYTTATSAINSTRNVNLFARILTE